MEFFLLVEIVSLSSKLADLGLRFLMVRSPEVRGTEEMCRFPNERDRASQR